MKENHKDWPWQAPFWHFWNPYSGLPGDLLAGVIIITGLLVWSIIR